jgi:molybdopterin/thiamine biosynthesis adenylyltransferase/ubiquitin-protein ligase
MIWWLFNSTRLFSEKATIANLAGEVDWLRITKWQANAEFAMCVEFEIDHANITYQFDLIYPSMFPDAPPMILTRHRERISNHQYGPDGELCLEHRPDNWHPSVTGADMITSCWRLLTEERPDQGLVIHARSAHVASLGRDLRSKYVRFLITNGDIEACNSLPELIPQPLSIRERVGEGAVIASILHIGDKDVPTWRSDLLLPKMDSSHSGFVVRVSGTGKLGSTDADSLTNLLKAANLHDLQAMLFDNSDAVYLLIGDLDNWELLWIFGEKSDRKTIQFSTVRVPATSRRVPKNLETLAHKRVGIVGNGSIGSKVAAGLCRSGVCQFLLIDEDIFLPGNVVRNELSLTDVGVHKSHAVKARLLEINPQCDVKALRLSLGGQESASSMSGALEALGECDLLIDATAEPAAFNMIGSVSKRKKKPMIWAEVFAGGIEGFVARARPDIDPIPMAVKHQMEVWCADQGVEWIKAEDEERYDGRDADGVPIIADDAAVTLIASHVTRFATDILVRPTNSIFPASVYFVGFTKDWIFEQPFDTRPILLQPDGNWGEEIDPLSPDQLLELLKEHLPKKDHGDAADNAP